MQSSSIMISRVLRFVYNSACEKKKSVSSI